MVGLFGSGFVKLVGVCVVCGLVGCVDFGVEW